MSPKIELMHTAEPGKLRLDTLPIFFKTANMGHSPCQNVDTFVQQGLVTIEENQKFSRNFDHNSTKTILWPEFGGVRHVC